MTKYIKKEWPDYQIFMEHPKFREDCFYYSEDNSYFIPEYLYNEVMNSLEYPKKYENTKLGTIVCYETRAIVNGDTNYWYDDIKKGNIALVYNHDDKEWYTSEIVACSDGFPIILENPELLIGINCELIGSYDPEIPF